MTNEIKVKEIWFEPKPSGFQDIHIITTDNTYIIAKNTYPTFLGYNFPEDQNTESIDIKLNLNDINKE